MPRFDHRAELAPRDIVARAIDHEMKRLGLECVYLDITHKSNEQIEEHFPTVKARCAELGLDIAQERIPVVPAAHYTCGGVVVDQHGATDVQGTLRHRRNGLHGSSWRESNGEQFITRMLCLCFQCCAAHEQQPPRYRAWSTTNLG